MLRGPDVDGLRRHLLGIGPFVSPVRLNAIERPDRRNRNCLSETGTAERRRK
jgi:hypothetical protein